MLKYIVDENKLFAAEQQNVYIVESHILCILNIINVTEPLLHKWLNYRLK